MAAVRLDVTFTMALPVDVAQLGAHFEAYLDTLAALNTLRACNRFGSGPQCYINKLPVELIQRIAHYHVLPVRKEKFEWWITHHLCYQDECDHNAHYTEDEMRDLYYVYYENHTEDGCSFPDEPTGSDLYGFLDEAEVGEDARHEDRILEWVDQVQKVLGDPSSTFNKHFGLKIWFSQNSEGNSPYRDDRTSNSIFSYLVLPDRATCTTSWYRRLSFDGYLEGTYESGDGMAVAPYTHASPEDHQKFKRALRVLGLEVGVNLTHSQNGVLSLAPAVEDQEMEMSSWTNDAASFPRPMLLFRNRIEDSDY